MEMTGSAGNGCAALELAGLAENGLIGWKLIKVTGHGHMTDMDGNGLK